MGPGAAGFDWWALGPRGLTGGPWGRGVAPCCGACGAGYRPRPFQSKQGSLPASRGGVSQLAGRGEPMCTGSEAHPLLARRPLRRGSGGMALPWPHPCARAARQWPGPAGRCARAPGHRPRWAGQRLRRWMSAPLNWPTLLQGERVPQGGRGISTPQSMQQSTGVCGRGARWRWGHAPQR